jgi:hypothetical protein
MAWKNFVTPLAMRSRRRVVATACVYGLSLAVRLSSTTGEEMEVPAARGICPMTSILISDGARSSYRNWPRPAQPIAFRNWALGSRSCSAACEDRCLRS